VGQRAVGLNGNVPLPPEQHSKWILLANGLGESVVCIGIRRCISMSM
jgi:hypothetical protein